MKNSLTQKKNQFFNIYLKTPSHILVVLKVPILRFQFLLTLLKSLLPGWRKRRSTIRRPEAEDRDCSGDLKEGTGASPRRGEQRIGLRIGAARPRSPQESLEANHHHCSGPPNIHHPRGRHDRRCKKWHGCGVRDP